MTPDRPSKIQTAIIYTIAVFLLAGDRFLKTLARHLPGARIELAPGISFHYQTNAGIAFSLPVGGMLLTAMLTVAIFFIFKYALIFGQKKRSVTALLLSIIGFAAISNIVDRLIYGAVIDYLDVRLFVCNIADVLISLLTGLLMIDFAVTPYEKPSGKNIGKINPLYK